MNIPEFIVRKWDEWKTKTFTKENFKKFLLVQVIDIAFVTCFFLALIEVIPFAIFIAFAICYVFAIVFKKVTHAAKTIKDVKNVYNTKEKKR